MNTTVPLWAFILTSVGGPVFGAAIAVLGSYLTNRHNRQTVRLQAGIERDANFDRLKVEKEAEWESWLRERKDTTYREHLQHAMNALAQLGMKRRGELQGKMSSVGHLTHTQVTVAMYGGRGVAPFVHDFQVAITQADETDANDLTGEMVSKVSETFTLLMTALHEDLRFGEAVWDEILARAQELHVLEVGKSVNHQHKADPQ